jgi:hypothetical protein
MSHVNLPVRVWIVSALCPLTKNEKCGMGYNVNIKKRLASLLCRQALLSRACVYAAAVIVVS